MRPTRRHVMLAAAAAAAEDWPQRPVRVVVPVAPGGSLDALSRLFGRHLGELGQPWLVENQGAGGGTSGSNPSSESGARSGPHRKKSPVRESFHESTSQPSASAA